jgi:polysaccharide deacetylase family protein (PEP-CTERM system associated)
MLVNALTVDVEDWFHATFLGVDEDSWPACEPRIVTSTRRILDILREEGVKATFFVLGWVAEKHPAIVQAINADEHEIACHSHYHRQVFRQTPEEFSADLRKSIASIHSAADVTILGYRAPAYSIGASQKWAFDIMVEQGIEYDSSILPVRTPFYGISGAEPFPHRVCEERLLEIPLSTVKFGPVRFPMAGGVYLRLLPLPFILWAIRRLNNVEGQPAVMYLHPWELDPQPPPNGRNALTRWSHTVNKRGMESRLRKLLSCFTFAPIREVFDIPG